MTNIIKNSFKLNELNLKEQAVLQEIFKDMKAFFEFNRIQPKPFFANDDRFKESLNLNLKKIVDLN